MTAMILLIDDDPDCRMLIREAIESLDGRYEVHECASAQEGVDFLQQYSPDGARPDLVFVDLEMPGLSGHDLLAIVRGDLQCNDVPIVVLTSVDDDEQERCALRNGANSYAWKGRSPETLHSTVREATRYWTHVHRTLNQ